MMHFLIFLATTEPSPIPWELIGGGGAAFAVLIAVHLMRKDSSETMKAVSSDFSNVVRDANEKQKQNIETFTESTATLVREARQAHEKCEETLHAILRDHLQRPLRRTDEP